MGTMMMMELSMKNNVKNFVYASSSSVYGDNQSPYDESMITDTPLSLYGATKKYNEMLAGLYSKRGLPCTGLRFFNCYGEWSRPDLAMWKWIKALYDNEPLEIYNYGDMWRDFTFIDDTVNGIMLAMGKIQENEIYNIGRGETVNILQVIELLEKETTLQGNKKMLECPIGQILKTHADITKARTELGYNPKVSIEEGLARFAAWYKEYHEISIEDDKIFFGKRSKV
jgi:UDP-glucuronate 4-epimerase